MQRLADALLRALGGRSGAAADAGAGDAGDDGGAAGAGDAGVSGCAAGAGGVSAGAGDDGSATAVEVGTAAATQCELLVSATAVVRMVGSLGYDVGGGAVSRMRLGCWWTEALLEMESATWSETLGEAVSCIGWCCVSRWRC